MRRMERGERQGAVAAVAAYCQGATCRRRAVLNHLGEGRAAGCDAAAGEQSCDACRDPQSAAAAVARVEAQLERLACTAAEGAAGHQRRLADNADPYDRADAGSGDEAPTRRKGYGSGGSGDSNEAEQQEAPAPQPTLARGAPLRPVNLKRPRTLSALKPGEDAVQQPVAAQAVPARRAFKPPRVVRPQQ